MKSPENLGSMLKRILGRRQNPFITVFIRYQIFIKWLSWKWQKWSQMWRCQARWVSPFEVSTCCLRRLRVNCTITQSMVKVIGFTGEVYYWGISKRRRPGYSDLQYQFPGGWDEARFLPGTPILTMCPAGPSKPHIGRLMRIREPTPSGLTESWDVCFPNKTCSLTHI